MIEELLDYLVHFNIELSLLLLCILLIRWGLRKSAQIYNSYWLWLVLPLAPLTALLVNSLPMAQKRALAESLMTMPTSVYSLDQANASLQFGDSQTQTLVTAPSTANTFHFEFLNSTWLWALLWFVGSLILFSRLIHQHRNLRSQLRQHSCEIEWHAATKAPVIGIKQKGFSPAVYGFFNPKIYFPIALLDQLTKDQKELIIEHEEQHIKQGHLWLNLAWDLLVVINWFNPIVYLARYYFRHDQEVHCDHLVLKNHDVSRQKAYGHALISTVSATHSVSLLCSWKMFDQLEERIMNIKNTNPKT